MADLFTLPESCLHEVPATVSDEAAVFTEPLAAALEIVEQSHIRPTERVAVIGDGKLGAMIVQVLRLTGCELTLVGRHPERWELYRQQGVQCISSIELKQDQFDVVIDCTGSSVRFGDCSSVGASTGRLILKSTFAAETH
jgi:Threonine dehydrogenase and related Zn-dependent dehydrogenases